MLHAACCTRCLYIQTANTVKSGQGGRQRWGWGWGIKPTLANRMQQLSAAGVRAGAGRSVFRKDYLPMQPDITRNTLALPLQMDGWVVPPTHLRPATPRPWMAWVGGGLSNWSGWSGSVRLAPARLKSLSAHIRCTRTCSARLRSLLPLRPLTRCHSAWSWWPVPRPVRSRLRVVVNSAY